MSHRDLMKSFTGLVMFPLLSSSLSLTWVKSEAKESLRLWKRDEERLILRIGRHFDRTPLVDVRFGFAIRMYFIIIVIEKGLFQSQGYHVLVIHNNW